MANFLAAACAGVMPLTVMVTARELGATAPILEIVNSHAARFSPDEVVIIIGGDTSVLPLEVAAAIDDYLRGRLIGGHCADSCAQEQNREAEQNERRCELSHQCPTLGRKKDGRQRSEEY